VREGRASGTVTVLFTDLVGSTELMSRFGAEPFNTIRQAHFAALRGAIGCHGGDEVKNTGDGLMVTFGSVVDALRCAIAMQQATERHARTGPAPIAIRVGVSIGEVTFEDGDVFGTPVVEAARLVGAAGRGKILATGIARALAAGRAELEFVDLGALDLKGLPDTVSACEVLWQPTAAALPMPTLLTDIGRVFVGRDREIERLGQVWKDAAAGERRIALISGEPGVGKTRLAAELAASAHGEGAVVLAGRCDEDLGVPYQPFVEALRHFLDHALEEDVAAQLGRYGGELVRLVPELADRLPALSTPLQSDPETERYRLFDGVSAWLAAAAERAPLLLVLDDLQWAAKPTLLLLRHVVCSADSSRLLVVGAYRDTELAHDHPLVEVLADLRRQGLVERVLLSGLDSAAVAAYLEHAAGHPLDDADLALAEAIHRETEGNPFFVREVLRHLAETGAIEQRDGHWVSRLPVEELGIPEGIREVVGKRLARLGGETNRLLRIAAVIGPEFESGLLRVTDDLDEEHLITALEEATRARLIVEGPDGRYRFAHALVQETLYQGLSGIRRMALHRRVAEAIEAVHSPQLDPYLPALAHHYGRAWTPAADTGKAVAFARRAGDRALVLLAADEAGAYYRQALELLDASESPANEAERLEVLISLGEAQRRTGDRTHRKTLLVAADLAKKRHDADALARAALANMRGVIYSSTGEVDADRVATLEAALEALGDDDSPTRARLLASLGLELMFATDRGRRVRLSDEALVAARRSGDHATLAHVLGARFYTIVSPATLSERVANTAEHLAAAEASGDPVAMTWARYLNWRVAIERGDVEAALPHHDVLETLVAELGQPTLSWIFAISRSPQLLLCGHLEDAEAAASEAARFADDEPEGPLVLAEQLFGVRLEQDRLEEIRPVWVDFDHRYPKLSFVGAMLARLDSELGRDDDARIHLERLAATGFENLPFDTLWALTMVSSATVAAHLDDRPRADTLHDLLKPYPAQIAGAGELWLGSISHYLALLASTLEHHDEADTRFAAAAAMHERMGASLWLARTRLEWARMLLTRRAPGDGDRARKLLSQALATARDLGLANVERRAAALLQ
jgi:class 3 adenylate cyclase